MDDIPGGCKETRPRGGKASPFTAKQPGNYFPSLHRTPFPIQSNRDLCLLGQCQVQPKSLPNWTLPKFNRGVCLTGLSQSPTEAFTPLGYRKVQQKTGRLPTHDSFLGRGGLVVPFWVDLSGPWAVTPMGCSDSTPSPGTHSDPSSAERIPLLLGVSNHRTSLILPGKAPLPPSQPPLLSPPLAA